MHILSASKQTAPTLQLVQFCPNNLLWTKSGTWWPFSQKASTQLNGITRSMTRRCSHLSMHWRNGDTSWKGHNSSLRFGLTTKTWSTSGQHRNSTGGKHNGPSTYPGLISCYTTNLEEAWANWTHFPNVWAMVMGVGTTRTSPSSDRNYLQFVLSKA
jgi:hypothetical protein